MVWVAKRGWIDGVERAKLGRDLTSRRLRRAWKRRRKCQAKGRFLRLRRARRTARLRQVARYERVWR